MLNAHSGLLVYQGVQSIHTSLELILYVDSKRLEIDLFDLKMMVKSGLDFFYFEIHRAPSEFLLPSAKISAQNGRIGLAA